MPATVDHGCGLAGLQVLATLAPEFPEQPLPVVSGTGDLNDAVQSLKRGAWDYVTKPIEDLDVLDHARQKALDRVRIALLISESPGLQAVCNTRGSGACHAQSLMPVPEE